MSGSKSCPECGSINLTMERSINGRTTCNVCGYRAPHSEFHEGPKQEDYGIISHDEIRKELGMWSRTARQKMRKYVTQQEDSEQKLSKIIDNQNQLIALYKQLSVLRNEQLKDVPFSQRGTTVELDVHVCNKIKRLRKRMGLPVDEEEKI